MLDHFGRNYVMYDGKNFTPKFVSGQPVSFLAKVFNGPNLLMMHAVDKVIQN
jgi:hypothetical protein